MDIHHAFSAHAVLTLGKVRVRVRVSPSPNPSPTPAPNPNPNQDMVFRDLAQGAFRMRGI